MRVYDSILDAVGNTPMVRLSRLGRGLEPTILAKVEYLNPGGSVKDRIGLAMVERAEAGGQLRAGGTIIEPTSGNTGVGLAIVAALKGYRCVFVMPDKVSHEKIALLRGYGADVLVVGVGTGGTVTGAGRYLKERKPALRVVGADPEGSIYSRPDDVHPYLVEGVGEDFYPATLDPSVVAGYVTVSDRDAFVMP